MYIGSCLNICMHTSNTWATNRTFLKKREQTTQTCALHGSEKQDLDMRAIPDLGPATCAVYAEIRRQL